MAMKKYQKRRLLWLGLMGVVFALVLAAGAASMRSQSLRTRVEAAHYRVLEEREGYELRAYDAQTVAQILLDGDIKTAVFRGFEPLSNYFFWNNERKPTPDNSEGGRERMQMTTPIIVQGDEPEVVNVQGHWMWFYLPQKYTPETAPTPKDERVKVEQKPAFEAAVIKFNGWGEMGAMREHEDLLRALLKRDGIAVAGLPLYARYDPPWTVPIFRRNEVILPVQR